MDFDSSPVDVTFLPKEVYKIVNISVMCDRVIEGPETFNISLKLMSISQHITVELGNDTSIGVINDSTGQIYGLFLMNKKYSCNVICT